MKCKCTLLVWLLQQIKTFNVEVRESETWLPLDSLLKGQSVRKQRRSALRLDATENLLPDFNYQ
jgi:hypothetical protein